MTETASGIARNAAAMMTGKQQAPAPLSTSVASIAVIVHTAVNLTA